MSVEKSASLSSSVAVAQAQPVSATNTGDDNQTFFCQLVVADARTLKIVALDGCVSINRSDQVLQFRTLSLHRRETKTMSLSRVNEILTGVHSPAYRALPLQMMTNTVLSADSDVSSSSGSAATLVSVASKETFAFRSDCWHLLFARKDIQTDFCRALESLVKFNSVCPL